MLEKCAALQKQLSQKKKVSRWNLTIWSKKKRFQGIRRETCSCFSMKVQLSPTESNQLSTNEPGRRPRAWRRSGGPHMTGQDVQVCTLMSPDTHQYHFSPPLTVLHLTLILLIPSLSQTLWWIDDRNDLSCSDTVNIRITCWLTQPANISQAASLCPVCDIPLKSSRPEGTFPRLRPEKGTKEKEAKIKRWD